MVTVLMTVRRPLFFVGSKGTTRDLYDSKRPDVSCSDESVHKGLTEDRGSTL